MDKLTLHAASMTILLTRLKSSLTAAKDAVGDKFEQKGHDSRAEVHRQAAKN